MTSFIPSKEPSYSSLSGLDTMLPIHKDIENKLDYFLHTSKIPHIIFHGNSGTGKRTILYNFINKIYKFDKYKIKTNVMFVNCAHGKGIKFIREELKFFAKTNIQSNSGVPFKTIVLMNADFLTIDAQSALRRCIELFSYNTRFFIVVENKFRVLNPILSRFCEIYVPEYMIGEKICNLHQYDLDKRMSFQEHDYKKEEYIREHLIDPSTIQSSLDHNFLAYLSNDFYENGISCLDLVKFIEKSGWWNLNEVNHLYMCFHKIKAEYRCEKLLMLYIMDYLYLREHKQLETI